MDKGDNSPPSIARTTWREVITPGLQVTTVHLLSRPNAPTRVWPAVFAVISLQRRKTTGGRTDAASVASPFPILPCREAGGQGLRGFVVPNRPTLPALISPNNPTTRPRSEREARLRQLAAIKWVFLSFTVDVKAAQQPAAASHRGSGCSGALINGFKAASSVPAGFSRHRVNCHWNVTAASTSAQCHMLSAFQKPFLDISVIFYFDCTNPKYQGL